MDEFLNFLIENKIRIFSGVSDSGKYYIALDRVWYYKDDLFEWEGVCEYSDCSGNALKGALKQLSGRRVKVGDGTEFIFPEIL